MGCIAAIYRGRLEAIFVRHRLTAIVLVSLPVMAVLDSVDLGVGIMNRFASIIVNGLATLLLSYGA